MFQTKFVENFKTLILYPKNLLRNSVFYEIMYKNDIRAKQATDQNIQQQRKDALCSWKTEATDTHSDYVTRTDFHTNNG